MVEEKGNRTERFPTTATTTVVKNAKVKPANISATIKEKIKMKLCSDCKHVESWHYAKQKQVTADGKKYVRTCYGIACTCRNIFCETCGNKMVRYVSGESFCVKFECYFSTKLTVNVITDKEIN